MMKTEEMDHKNKAANVNSSRAKDGDRIMVGGMPVRKHPRIPRPDVYRDGDTPSDYGGRTTGGDSDEDGETCLIVVSKAALVDDERRH